MSVSKSIAKRAKRNRAGEATGTVWRARYRDDSGREHVKHFDRRADGVAWLDQQTADLVHDEWVDPSAGSMTLRQFYTSWAPHQVWEHSTRLAMDLAVLNAPFVDRPLREITLGRDVQPWIKAMSARGLAPGTISTRMTNVRTVLRAAKADRRMKHDPTDGV